MENLSNNSSDDISSLTLYSSTVSFLEFFGGAYSMTLNIWIIAVSVLLVMTKLLDVVSTI